MSWFYYGNFRSEFYFDILIKVIRPNVNHKKWLSRAGKIRFYGEWKPVLLQASPGERCASHNFMLPVTLRSQSVCLTLYLIVHQIKQIMERKMLKYIQVQLYSVLLFFLWQHNYTLENHMFLEWLWLWVGFLRNLHLIKSKRSIFRSSCKFYRKLFLTTSLAAAVLHLYVFFSKCITVQSRFSNTRKMELFVTNVKS